MSRNPLNDNDIDGNTMNLGLYDRCVKSMQRIVEEKQAMINYKDFEDYLSQKFADGDGAIIFDDMWPDCFNEWMAGLSVDEWLDYGDKYKKLKENI